MVPVNMIEVRKLCYRQKFEEAVACMPNADQFHELQDRDKRFALALYRCSQRFKSLDQAQAAIRKSGYRPIADPCSDLIAGNFVVSKDLPFHEATKHSYSLRFVGRGALPRSVGDFVGYKSPEEVRAAIQKSDFDLESDRVALLSRLVPALTEDPIAGDEDMLAGLKNAFANQYQAWRDNPDVSGLQGEFKLRPFKQLRDSLFRVYSEHTEYHQKGFDAMVEEYANDDFYAFHDLAIQYQVSQGLRNHEHTALGPTP